MRKIIVFLCLIMSGFCIGQKDYALIDHTIQRNETNALHLTDSLMYYSLYDYNSLFGISTFNNIDSNGVRNSEIVYGGSTSCKFIPMSQNHLRGFYYNLLQGDLYEQGLYQVDLINGAIHIINYDLGDFYEIRDIEKNTNNEFLIIENQNYNIIDELGNLLLQTDLVIDNTAYFVRNKSEVYLVVDNLIYHVNG